MNQTEAWEMVLKAAQTRLSIAIDAGRKAEFRALATACNKVAPRVERMRSRLDFARAKKAGTLKRPSWATP